MDWKKEHFLIAERNDDDEVIRVYVKGITTTFQNAKVGIYKREDTKDWIITDVSTGYMMQVAKTQKAAKTWVETYQGIILEIINQPHHKKHVEEMSKCRIKSE